MRKEDNLNMYDELISVVVPIFNEEDNIQSLYDSLSNVLKEYKYEIIMVNDGSNDCSDNCIKELVEKDPRVKLINFTRNFGHEAATTAGVEYAKGDAVIVIDADLQDPPELILDMIKLWENGYEVIYAQRETRKGETIIKRITASLFYKFLDLISETHIPRNTGDFRLMDRKVVNDFKKFREKNRLFRGLISWVGYRQIGIKFNRNKRHAGKTKYNYFKLFRLALDSITSFSTKPLFFITLVGFMVSLFSFFLGIYFILQKLIFKFPIPGWTSLIVTFLFFNGFQIFLIGIVGEYIGRMFIEIKDRPLYLVEEIVDNQKKNNLQTKQILTYSDKSEVL